MSIIEYPKKVLLATGGTEDSSRAAEVAVALAAQAGAELHMLHVGRSAAYAYGVAAEGGPLPNEPSGYAEQQARKPLERQVEEIRAIGGTVTEPHLRIGLAGRRSPRTYRCNLLGPRVEAVTVERGVGVYTAMRSEAKGR